MENLKLEAPKFGNDEWFACWACVGCAGTVAMLATLAWSAMGCSSLQMSAA